VSFGARSEGARDEGSATCLRPRRRHHDAPSAPRLLADPAARTMARIPWRMISGNADRSRLMSLNSSSFGSALPSAPPPTAGLL